MTHHDPRTGAARGPLPPLDLSLATPPIEARCGRCGRSFSVWAGYVSVALSVCDACLVRDERPPT